MRTPVKLTYFTNEIPPPSWMEFTQKALYGNNMQRKADDKKSGFK